MIAPRIAIIAAALTLTAPLDLFAQEEPAVSPGDRVRITAPGFGVSRALTSNVVAVKPDTLVVDSETGTGPTAVPLDAITKLEVSLGRQSNVGKGALIGGGVGAGTGLVLGLLASSTASEPECTPDSFLCIDFETTAGDVMVASAILGGIGAAVGAVMGAIASSEEWDTVPLDGMRVSVTPRLDGSVAIAASVNY